MVGASIALEVGSIATVVTDLLRNAVFFTDSIVYAAAGAIYTISISMYDITQFISEAGQKSIITRMMNITYSFLAIVMFFKLAISLLQMLIDPSLAEDKQKGLGKLALNIMIMLVLIVLVPKAFDISRKVQTKIMSEHVIEKTIYGDNYNTSVISMDSVGHRLSLSVWSIFLHPQKTLTNNENTLSSLAWKDFFKIDKSRNLASYTWDTLKLSLVLNERSLILVGKYQLSYMCLISTIAGLYLLWIMLKLGIDVAYRSLKYLVLEIVSPIAIVSYIDPKSSKDGIFAKWLKEVIKTYLSLFIRMAIFALASILLIEFSSSFGSTEFNFAYSFLGGRIMYVLAILALIKSGPKLIDQIFGSELTKESETKFAKDMLGGLFGGAARMAVGGIAGASAVKATGGSKWDAFKGGLKNGLKGAREGFQAGKKGDVLGLITGGFDSYRGIKKDYGLLGDSEHERLINSMAANGGLVDRVKSLTDRRKNELEDPNSNEISNSITGTDAAPRVLSGNGQSINMRALDSKLTSGNAQMRNISEKYELSKTKYENMGLKNSAVFVAEAAAQRDLDEAKLLKQQAEQYQNAILSQSGADRQNMIKLDIETKWSSMDSANKIQILQTSGVKNANTLSESDIEREFQRIMSSDMNSVKNAVYQTKDDIEIVSNIAEARTVERFGTSLDSIKLVVSAKEKDAKDATTNKENYLKTTDGARDAKLVENYNEASGVRATRNNNGNNP